MYCICVVLKGGWILAHLPVMLRVESRRLPVIESVLLRMAQHISRGFDHKRVLWGWPTVIRPIMHTSSSTTGQLGVAVWWAHGHLVMGPIPLQRQLHEAFTQWSGMLPFQIPHILVLFQSWIWAQHLWTSLLKPSLTPLGSQIQWVSLGLLVGGQLLCVKLVKMARWTLRVLVVTLVLLSLWLLTHGRLQKVRLLLCKAFQGWAWAPSASTTAAAAPTKSLLLDGQESTCICRVPVAQLLLDEPVQHRAWRLLCSSHLSQFVAQKQKWHFICK